MTPVPDLAARIEPLLPSCVHWQMFTGRCAGCYARAALAELVAHTEQESDLLNWAWSIICNVSEGDWTKQPDEWQAAVLAFREKYHASLAVSVPSPSPERKPE